MCGIVGVIGKNAVAYEVYLGLLAIKNRGTNSSGIITYNSEKSRFHRIIGARSVDHTFAGFDFSRLSGNTGIGHNRYATTASKEELYRDSQPVLTDRPGIALAFNGHLAQKELKKRQIEDGWTFNTSCDVELIIHALSQKLVENKAYKAKTIDEYVNDKLFPSLHEAMKELDGYGSYSVVAIIDKMGLLAFRDPHGIRPLSVAEKRIDGIEGYAFASESAAFNLMGNYHNIRELSHGEAVFIDKDLNITSKIIMQKKESFCSFEQVYFSEIESTILGEKVFITRERLGEALAESFNGLKDRIDRVVTVPRTPEVAAIKLARLWNKDYGGIVKRSGIDVRSFLEPTEEARKKASGLKYLYIKPLLEGKSIAVVDDSIVRGTTSLEIVNNLKSFGVREIHFFSMFPPIMHPCRYGIDTPRSEDLIAYTLGGNLEKLREYLGVDTLNYLPVEKMVEVLGAPTDRFCTACVTGDYPV